MAGAVAPNLAGGSGMVQHGKHRGSKLLSIVNKLKPREQTSVDCCIVEDETTVQKLSIDITDDDDGSVDATAIMSKVVMPVNVDIRAGTNLRPGNKVSQSANQPNYQAVGNGLNHRKVVSSKNSVATEVIDLDDSITEDDTNNEVRMAPDGISMEGDITVVLPDGEDRGGYYEKQPRAQKKSLTANELSAREYEDAAREDNEEIPDSIVCTACGKSVSVLKEICKHSKLGVLVCKKCLKFVNTSTFSRDELGIEEYCTWCGDGGKLVCCDFCEKAYCKHCVKRNLGKVFLKALLGADEGMKWQCFVCDPFQLQAFHVECDNVIRYVEKKKLARESSESKVTPLGGPSQSERLKRLSAISDVVQHSPSKPVRMQSSFPKSVSKPHVSEVRSAAIRPDTISKSSIVDSSKHSASSKVVGGTAIMRSPKQLLNQPIGNLPLKVVPAALSPSVLIRKIPESQAVVTVSHGWTNTGKLDVKSPLNSALEYAKTSRVSPREGAVVSEQCHPFSQDISSMKAEEVSATDGPTAVKQPKKQQVVLLSDSDDSEAEIVLVTKSGKRKVISASVLLAAQAAMEAVQIKKKTRSCKQESDSSLAKSPSAPGKVFVEAPALPDNKDEREGAAKEVLPVAIKNELFREGGCAEVNSDASEAIRAPARQSARADIKDRRDEKIKRRDTLKKGSSKDVSRKRLGAFVRLNFSDKVEAPDSEAESSGISSDDDAISMKDSTADSGSESLGRESESEVRSADNGIESRNCKLKKKKSKGRQASGKSSRAPSRRPEPALSPSDTDSRLGRIVFDDQEPGPSGVRRPNRNQKRKLEQQSEDADSDSSSVASSKKTPSRKKGKAETGNAFAEPRSEPPNRENNADQEEGRDVKGDECSSANVVLDESVVSKPVVPGDPFRSALNGDEIVMTQGIVAEGLQGDRDTDKLLSGEHIKDFHNVGDQEMCRKDGPAFAQETELSVAAGSNQVVDFIQEPNIASIVQLKDVNIGDKSMSSDEDVELIFSESVNDGDPFTNDFKSAEEAEENGVSLLNGKLASNNGQISHTTNATDAAESEEDSKGSDENETREVKSRRGQEPRYGGSSQSGSDSGSSRSSSASSDVKASKRVSSRRRRSLSDAREDSTKSKSDSESSVEAKPRSKRNVRLRKGRLRKSRRRKSCASDGDGSHDEDFDKDLEEVSPSSDSESLSEVVHDSKKKSKGKSKGKKVVIDDSDEENEGDEEDSPAKKGRRNIRKIIKDKDLNEETRHAYELEEQRRKRLLERTKAEEKESVDHIMAFEEGDCVLERDQNKDVLVSVSSELSQHLKPHQAKGVQFIYDCAIESVKAYKNGDPGGGCILAHCMGLGKTLQVIAFIHTAMTNKNINMKTFLVVAPLNTVLNWEQEFEKWLPVQERMDVYCLSYASNTKERIQMLKDWSSGGGILIVGYEMYRNLVNFKYVKSKKFKEIIKSSLVEPGPQLVVCDEGHVLRNSNSAISKALMAISTKRRVVLTGTPLQNNLSEYFVMVDFIKPNLLGTKKEFFNRFIHPIQNGQCSDSTPRDVRVMKQRCHILFQLLQGCVQRQDYSVLTPFLPSKREYTIFVRLSPKQIKMYQHYLDTFVIQTTDAKVKGASLFSDYHCLSRIWSHPWALQLEKLRQAWRDRYKQDDDSMEEFIDDEVSESDSNPDEKGTSAKKVWTADTDSDDEDDAKRRRLRNKNNKLGVSSDDESETGDSDATGSQASSKPAPPKPRHSRLTRAQRAHVFSKDSDAPSSVDQTSGGNHVTSHDSDGDSNIVVVKANGSDEMQDLSEKDGGGKCISVEDLEPEWYDQFLSAEDEHDMELSGKLVLLMEILADAEVVGDKVLVFSQSLISLDLIEKCLGGGKIGGNLQSWLHGVDYFRMDGSTPVHKRKRWAEIFNDPDNLQCRLFLISTKAGSLGINMVGANRVIVFDCSWNPSHDVQSVFRVYRFGQEKPCYIYRFIAQGTMEEKVYDRQITKLAVAGRVVDEQQIERHFTDEEIRELYTFAPETLKEGDVQETPQLPKDPLLAEVLQRQHPKWIVRFHEHDLLLENIADEELNEEERKQAWTAYNQEKDLAARGIETGISSVRGSSHYARLEEEQRRRQMLEEQARRYRQSLAPQLQAIPPVRYQIRLPPDIDPSDVPRVEAFIDQQTLHLRRQMELERESRNRQLANIALQYRRYVGTSVPHHDSAFATRHHLATGAHSIPVSSSVHLPRPVIDLTSVPRRYQYNPVRSEAPGMHAWKDRSGV